MPEGDRFEAAFYGGSFTAIPAQEQEELLGAVLPFLRSGDGIRLSTRPDCIDENVLNRLKRYGVTTIELGTQSLDNEVLKRSGRGHTAEDTVRAAKMVKDSGFQLIIQMMTGLPGDTPEKSIATAKKICDLHPDGVRIYPTVIIRDTALCDMWQDGRYKEHTVEDAVELCATLADIFENAGIPIIRLGLNPTEELSGGSAVAGAYHPALGELVYSRRYLKKAQKLLRERKPTGDVTLGVNSRRISMMVGQKRQNIEALRREFGVDVKVVPMDIPENDIVLVDK
jgi:histone acetyltransferase (RNA polymerase elongator complex component)